MTREELKKNIRSLFYSSKTVEKYLEKAYALIDQIFDDHETAIEILMKANEEEISRHFNECEKYEAELKALQQHKSCEGCVRESEDMVDPHCAFCSRACKDNYEEKGNK